MRPQLVSKANVCHGMGVQQSKRTGDWDVCEGTIDMEAYIGIVQRHILPSRWCLSWDVHGYCIKTMPDLILHVLQQRGFVDRVNVLDWPADLTSIENVWIIMKKRIRQRPSQTAELLKSNETGQKLKRLVSPIPKQSNIVIQMKVDVTQLL